MMEALDPEGNWLLLAQAGRAGGKRAGLVDRVENAHRAHGGVGRGDPPKQGPPRGPW